MMVLSLLISPALPFLTLTLPYIIAAQVTMRESESRGVAGKGVFLCSIAEIYDEEGNHVANIKVFMSKKVFEYFIILGLFKYLIYQASI